MRTDSRHLPLRAALCAVLAVLPGQRTAATPVPENDLKAAFVFNFAVFAEWPIDTLAAGAPLRLCASPGTGLYASLERLNDKPVNGHRIALRALGAGAAARGCHLVVLAGGDRDRWPELRRELAGASVLTVSDDRAISADGAIIGLSVEFERVGFDVDMGAARAARLAVSSKLLRLARRVR